MLTDLNNARHALNTGDYTCVVCHGTQYYYATARGVRPLLNWLEEGLELRGFCAADRVVGRATAFLYVLLGVRSVYARVMSRPAAQVLESYGIGWESDALVDGIINRQGTGPCPFEAAVMNISDAAQALTAIRTKMKQLTQEATP